MIVITSTVNPRIFPNTEWPSSSSLWRTQKLNFSFRSVKNLRSPDSLKRTQTEEFTMSALKWMTFRPPLSKTSWITWKNYNTIYLHLEFSLIARMLNTANCFRKTTVWLKKVKNFVMTETNLMIKFITVKRNKGWDFIKYFEVLT